MIPELNDLGLLPAGIHTCSLSEFSAVFAHNSKRQALLESLLKCIADMHEHRLQGTLLLDGSFVTDKQHPNDMEVVLDVRECDKKQQANAMMFHLEKHGVLEGIGIDWYPTITSQHDFTAFFQYAGDKTAAAKLCSSKHPKGIIRIEKW